MGRIVHHSIVVTTYSQEQMYRARDVAREVFGAWVHAPFPSPVNGYWTLCVGPDGSKEGWAQSNEADRQRLIFVSWLKAQSFEDGSSPFAWVEVEYGGEEHAPARVLGDSGRWHAARASLPEKERP